MKKIPKQAYTTEFKELAVKRVTDGDAIGVVIKEAVRQFTFLCQDRSHDWTKAGGQAARQAACAVR